MTKNLAKKKSSVPKEKVQKSSTLEKNRKRIFPCSLPNFELSVSFTKAFSRTDRYNGSRLTQALKSVGSNLFLIDISRKADVHISFNAADFCICRMEPKHMYTHRYVPSNPVLGRIAQKTKTSNYLLQVLHATWRYSRQRPEIKIMIKQPWSNN